MNAFNIEIFFLFAINITIFFLFAINIAIFFQLAILIAIFYQFAIIIVFHWSCLIVSSLHLLKVHNSCLTTTHLIFYIIYVYMHDFGMILKYFNQYNSILNTVNIIACMGYVLIIHFPSIYITIWYTDMFDIWILSSYLTLVHKKGFIWFDKLVKKLFQVVSLVVYNLK